MKGDFTRRTFRPEKHYSSVRMQQGRVQLDADWNEQVEIQQHLTRTQFQDMIGRTGVPSRRPNGFRIQINTPNEITIDPGRIYVDGIACDLDAQIKFTEQPDFPGARINIELPALVYIEVWERHITALEDPDIVEVALGGPDTGTRTRIVWQVKVLQPDDIDKLDEIDLDAEFAPPTPPNVRSDTIPPTGNQLYRIEIHEGTSDDDDADVTFKWSRDNGSAVAEWTSGTGGINDPVEVNGLGRVQFEPKQFVELIDEAHELRGEPGELRRIEKVVNTPGKQTLTLDSAVTGTYTTGKKARRWDSIATAIKPSAGGDDFVSLPDGGVQVAFFKGRYRTGDAWLVPVRLGGIRSNVATPAEEPRHYAKLAIIRSGQRQLSISADLRTRFLSIPEIQTGTVPSGVIVMWSGTESDIPPGWLLCAGGTTKTGRPIPDLRSRFIVGAGPGSNPFYRSHDNAAPDVHQHSVSVPALSGATSFDPGHNHGLHGWFGRKIGYIAAQDEDFTLLDTNGMVGLLTATQSGGGHSHSVSVGAVNVNTGPSGGENRPRWYALCFIMKE